MLYSSTAVCTLISSVMYCDVWEFDGHIELTMIGGYSVFFSSWLLSENHSDTRVMFMFLTVVYGIEPVVEDVSIRQDKEKKNQH